MHDDDLSPVERAEQIVDAAANQHVDQLAAAILSWPALAERLFKGIEEMLPKLVEALQPLAELMQQIERDEVEAFAALEDDFYNGRGASP